MCSVQVKKEMSMILYWIPLLCKFTTTHIKINGCNELHYSVCLAN